MVVFYQIPNEVVAQASGIVGIVFVYDERVSIIAIETFSGGKPHEAPVILQNGNDIVLSQPIPGGEVDKSEVCQLSKGTSSLCVSALGNCRFGSVGFSCNGI